MKTYEMYITDQTPQLPVKVTLPPVFVESVTRPQPLALTHRLIQMQRIYGNRYVQYSLAFARKRDEQNYAAPAVEFMIQRARGGGQPLDSHVRARMESTFGIDFSKVRIHTGTRANQLNRILYARAFATGQDIFFRDGEYAPGTLKGRELLAHELAHVVQQRDKVQHKLMVGQPSDEYEQEADRAAQIVMRQEQTPIHHRTSGITVNRQSALGIQRRVSLDVLDWDALKLGPPTLQNWSDPHFFVVPPTGQISVSALVQVNGAAGDPCTQYEIGTTQTAWRAWTVASYQGQSARDGSVIVRHRATMPMRDPGPSGNVWYDPTGGRNVLQVNACGDSVGIFHVDSPWHAILKARVNRSVPGNPLNYLRSYTRGLHLVTYLTARDPSGNFLPRPLRFLYWNSLQDFQFTPNFANPLAMWNHTGRVQVNIGAKGSGATTDAPYFTTNGPHFNDHFNNSANWAIVEQS